MYNKHGKINRLYIEDVRYEKITKEILNLIINIRIMNIRNANIMNTSIMNMSTVP
jgi:hypothetical protein